MTGRRPTKATGPRQPCSVTIEFVPGQTPTNRPETTYAEDGSYVWKCTNGNVGTGVARFSVAQSMGNRHARVGCVPAPNHDLALATT